MKNLHLIPTDKPSRLRYNLSNVLALTKEPYRDYRKQVNQHIYITSDEEIKEGDWCLYNKNHNAKVPNWFIVKCGKIEREEMHPISNGKLLLWMKKIILTTDQELIKDGVQAIDDDFLEWFVKNPSCEQVEFEKGKEILGEVAGTTYIDFNYKIIIPQEEPKQIKCYCGHTITCDCGPLEEPKQETLEEAAEREASLFYEKGSLDWNKYRQVFTEGAKWQAERMYSEEDLEEAFKAGREGDMVFNTESPKYWDFNQWFEQSKKK
jgi:hypothetical protein